MSRKIDLGNTQVNKIFWTYAIPSILAMIAQSTAGFVDSIFVGRYVGPEGLSAITLVMPIMWLMIGFGAMIAIGGTTLAGIEYGKNNFESSNNYFNVTLSLLLISALVATGVIQMFSNQIAAFVGASGLVKDYMVVYMTTSSMFYMFFLLNFAFSFFLKLDSKPVIVVLITLSGTLINVVLDYWMVARSDMGMYGAALATGLSQLLPWLMFLLVVIFKSVWTFKRPMFVKKDIIQIFFNGSSEMMNNISVSITGVLFNWIIIESIGIEGIAAYAVAMQISSLAVSFGYGFSESNQTGVSYNFGAKQFDRVSALRKLTQKVNVATGFLLFLVSFFYGESLAKIFVTNPETIKLASEILKIFSVTYIIVGLNISFGTYYTAVNDPISSVIVSLLRSLIALAVGLFVLPLLFGSAGIWGSVLFAEVITLGYGLWLMKRYPYGRNVKLDHVEKIKLESVA